MEKWKENIDLQFEFNKGKNIFYKGIVESLHFSPETLNSFDKINSIDAESQKLLIDYLTERFIQECCKINQYYNFDKEAKKELRILYVNLFSDIKNRESDIKTIAKKHYNSLAQWLESTNPFAEKIYSSKGEKIEAVACYQYSAKLQVEILQIDLKTLLEPVLDIGCGENGSLVKYLRSNGIEAYGFDRFAFDDTFLSNSDWFEYPFEKNHWGTITSNLGFSNHFQHHHQRSDGNYIDYAKKYMEILNSLKTGGSFHYAPDLSFIEQYLDKNKYQSTKKEIGNYNFKSTKIIRLK